MERHDLTSEKRQLIRLIAAIWMGIGILVILGGGFVYLQQRPYSGDFNIGVIVVISGIILLGIGYGFWKLNFLSWLITVVLCGLITLGYLLSSQVILSFLQTGSWEWVLPPIVVVILLIGSISVRKSFTEK